VGDSFDIRSLPYSWLLAIIILIVFAAAFGAIGYIIATRRIKQPIVIFLFRFGVGFFLLFFFEYAILRLLPSVHAAIQSFTATLVGGILSFAGVSHSVSGSTLSLQDPSLTFDVTVSCLGGLLFWTYAALVLAETSASNKQRLWGMLIGLSILILFNFFRITLSVYVEWRTGFSIHNLFYFSNMIVVILVWAVWLWRLKPKRVIYSRATS
jgi:exosortase/archaeosortase family protein